MDDLPILEDGLYKEENEADKIIESTKTILPEVDNLLTERVERITLKGQLDDDKISG